MADLAHAVSFYCTTFNLDDKVKWLDLQCIEASERQASTSKTRKQLADETKLTRKEAQQQTHDGQLVFDSFSKLLKLYQQEIDSLTKRSKLAESALSELYRALYQAPNPAPFLLQQASVEQSLLKQKLETANLKRELAEFEDEFAQLKNQDITIRQQSERIAQLELALDEKDRVQAEARSLLQEQMVDELDCKQELEDARAQLEQTEAAYEEQRRACEQARHELHEFRFQSEERDHARLRELDQLHEELAAYQQSTSAEARLSSGEELARLRARDAEEETKQRARREEEMAQMYAQLDQQRVEAARLRAADAKRERDADELKQRHRDQQQRDRDRIAELEHALQQQQQQQQQVQLASSSTSEQQPAANGTADEQTSSSSSSWETANAQLRLALADKDANAERTARAVLAMEEQLADSQALVRRLQDQLDDATSRSSHTTRLAPGSPLPAEAASSSSSSGGGVIGILQEQRDRFRRRMLELEQELETSTTKEKRAKEQLERLRSDNCALRVSSRRGGGDFFSLPKSPSPLQQQPLAGSKSPVHLSIKFLLLHPTASRFVAAYFVLLHVLVYFVFSVYSTSSAFASGGGFVVAPSEPGYLRSV